MSAVLSLTLISPSPSISGLLACLIVTFVCLFIFYLRALYYFRSTSVVLPKPDRALPPYLVNGHPCIHPSSLSLFLAFPLSHFHSFLLFHFHFFTLSHQAENVVLLLQPDCALPPHFLHGHPWVHSSPGLWRKVGAWYASKKQKTNNQTNQNKQGG